MKLGVILSSIIVTLINSGDIFYNLSYKFGVSPLWLYLLQSFCLLLVIFLFGIELKLSRPCILFGSIFLLYLSLQFTRGAIETGNLLAPLSALSSYVGVFTFYLFLRSLKFFFVCRLLATVFYLSFVLYFFCDIGSLFWLGKSQHVLLFNILPFQLLTLMTLKIMNYKNIKLAVSALLVFTLYSICSVYYGTEDQRLQLKALILLPMIVSGYYLILVMRPVLQRFFLSRKRNTIVPIITFFILIFLCSIAALAVFNLDILSIINRVNSGTIRELIVKEMIKDILASDAKVIWGAGIGTTVKAYYIYYSGEILFMKSHSGILSLLYEHGIFSFVFIFIFIFIIFYGERSFLKEKELLVYEATSLLMIIFYSWLILNAVYLIALPSANYVDQTQIYSLILMVFVLKNIMLGKSINHCT